MKSVLRRTASGLPDLSPTQAYLTGCARRLTQRIPDRSFEQAEVMKFTNHRFRGSRRGVLIHVLIATGAD